MRRWGLLAGWALLGSVVIAAPPVLADPPGVAAQPGALQRVVDRLGVEANVFDPSGIVGITVIRLDTGETASYQGDRWIKSASSLKPTWVVTAIRAAGIDAVEPEAERIWVGSSNEAGGRVIRLAGGLDAVNRFTAGIGMATTEVVEWTFGGEWRSADYPGPHPSLNFTSTDDLAHFWRLVRQGWLMSSESTATFLEWGRLPRPPGYVSGLLTRLPVEAWPFVSFKMGWLPPGRTEEDKETGEVTVVDALDLLIGAGVVEVPGEPAYVVAIGSMGGSSWPGKVAFVAYAACRIHETITAHGADCDRPGDPHRLVADTDPPRGELVGAVVTPTHLVVRGWSVDPDDPVHATSIAVVVDGMVVEAVEPLGTPWWLDPDIAPVDERFAAVVVRQTPPGEHEVCVTALNDGDGPATAIGCRITETRRGQTWRASLGTVD